MKRKAGSVQKATKPTKSLKSSTKAKATTPSKVAKKAPPPEEYSSSDGDIGDIDEYMRGGESDSDLEANTVVDFDDGEVTLNLPQHQKKR
jgi:hypothetical protein